jgi:cytochrome c
MRRNVVILLLLSGATGLALPATRIALAQDAAAGEKTFNVCRACHQIGANAKNAIGPVLNGVVGRKSGTYPEYAYSDANRNSGLTWDEPTLKEYLKNPMAKVPGTKMAYPGLRKDEDIENVIAFLKQYGPNGTLGEAQSPSGVPRPPL